MTKLNLYCVHFYNVKARSKVFTCTVVAESEERAFELIGTIPELKELSSDYEYVKTIPIDWESVVSVTSEDFKFEDVADDDQIAEARSKLPKSKKTRH